MILLNELVYMGNFICLNEAQTVNQKSIAMSVNATLPRLRFDQDWAIFIGYVSCLTFS